MSRKHDPNPVLHEAIHDTLELAKQLGADKAEVLLSTHKKHVLKAQKGQISENKVSNTRVMGVRLEREGQLGIAYSESLQAEDRRKMMEMALAQSHFAKKDPHCGIRVSAEAPYLPDCSHLYHTEDVSLEEKEEMTLFLESAPLQKDRRVKVVPYNALSEHISEEYVANSLGVFCYDRERSFNCFTYALMEDNGRKADFGEVSVARHFQELDALGCVETVCREAALLLNSKALSSGSYDVIFHPDALESLFNTFGIMFSGQAAKNKLNPLRDKLGEKIASPLINIVDLPRMQDSLHTCFFDSEGAIPEDLSLVEDGVLQDFYHNSETAHYFGISSNHRALRSPHGSLGTGGNTLVISAGTDSAVRSGKFFEIWELDGLHSGCDSISGDFSVPCSGKFYDGEKLIHSVKDVTIAGNFYQMLNQVASLGTELKYSTGRSFYSPDIRFSGMGIAG